jgi:hypothetical protein
VFRKTTEDLERIRDPRSSVANANDGNPLTDPLYVFSTTFGPSLGGVISAAFPYATSCLAPVLEGGPE